MTLAPACRRGLFLVTLDADPTFVREMDPELRALMKRKMNDFKLHLNAVRASAASITLAAARAVCADRARGRGRWRAGLYVY